MPSNKSEAEIKKLVEAQSKGKLRGKNAAQAESRKRGAAELDVRANKTKTQGDF